jgi:hypothetical protein
MELDDPALPLTRGQLDIWLAQETGGQVFGRAIDYPDVELCHAG